MSATVKHAFIGLCPKVTKNRKTHTIELAADLADLASLVEACGEGSLEEVLQDCRMYSVDC